MSRGAIQFLPRLAHALVVVTKKEFAKQYSDHFLICSFVRVMADDD